MKIDIGCGDHKRVGFVGIDAVKGPNSDIICDIAMERWPIENDSVDYVLSSHCLEHISKDQLIHVFQEISRVSRDGAVVEFWLPHAFHRDAYVLGHVSYFTEVDFYHFCGEVWALSLGARWNLREVRYHVSPLVLSRLGHAGILAETAVMHMTDVIKEFGVFIEIHKSDAFTSNRPFQLTIVDDVPGILLHETRTTNLRPIDVENATPRRFWSMLEAPIRQLTRCLKSLRKSRRRHHAASAADRKAG